MSLWKVDDYAIQLLMTYFYKNWLSGNSLRESLKEAKNKLILKMNTSQILIGLSIFSLYFSS
jgi:CHAT domain-containing protein